MKTFRVFEKSNKITIPTTFVICGIIILCTYFSRDIEYYFGLSNKFLGLFLCVLFIVLMIKSLFSTQKLRGKFNGVLKMENDRISISSKEYLLEDIDNIDLYQADCIGHQIHVGTVALDNDKSNGTDNRIELNLKNGKKIISYFQVQKENDLLINKNILIDYHLKGKIPLLRLTNILGINDYEELKLFKRNLKTTT
jgi:hypothetical protein